MCALLDQDVGGFLEDAQDAQAALGKERVARLDPYSRRSTLAAM